MTTPSPELSRKFEDFSLRFISEAEAKKSKSIDSRYVVNALSYARKLMHSDLPVIFDRDHFCALVGYSRDFVDGAATSSSVFYRRFSVKKKSGGFRDIYEPLPSLKYIQRWILDNIISRIHVSPAAKAFLPGRGIRDSARFHLGRKFVLRMDIEGFFPSISQRRVFGLFRSFGYSSDVSYLISRLCCMGGELPQGSPTSPCISNLILRRLDARLLAFSKKNNLRYTRYADDFTISGESFSWSLVDFVSHVVFSEGFKINQSKTRVMRGGSRQVVVGAVVNSHLNSPREFRRELRKCAYFIERHGLDGHLQAIDERRSGVRDYYLGKASFALHLNSRDRDAIALRDVVLRECSDEVRK